VTGLDVSKGLAMTGGTMQLYKETLAVFYEDGYEKLEQITECLEQSDLPLFTTYVHAIKSSSGSIGAGAISEFAEILEKAGKNRDIEFINSLSAVFLSDFEKLLVDIHSFINQDKDDMESSESMSMDSLVEWLVKLKEAVAELDIEMINEIEHYLHLYAQTDKTNETINKIKSFKLTGSYDEIEALVDEMLASLSFQTTSSE
jgi:HPt (histidine-containing phosphotransfer) domain-containing protein